MKCPQCGTKMEPGFLQSSANSTITWVSKLLPMGLGYWKNDAEIVSDMMQIGINAIPTHICKQCKLIFGNYSKK